MLAYAYVEIAIRFGHAFVDHESPLMFHAPDGKTAPVYSFGAPDYVKGHGDTTYRRQVEILFSDDKEFAIDLDRHSRPYQVLVARLHRPATLQAGLDTIRARVAEPKRVKPSMDSDTVLLVPSMHWRIEHIFTELSGKEKAVDSKLPEGTRTDKVTQTISFRLNHIGAAVESSAAVQGWDNGAHEYLLDHPFLVVCQVRDGSQPILAVWVDNAELLQPWPPK